MNMAIRGTLRRFLNARQRVVFDPANPEHLRVYANFLKHSSWEFVNERGERNQIFFQLEVPFEDIPTMVARKIAVHHMRQILGMEDLEDPAILASQLKEINQPFASVDHRDIPAFLRRPAQAMEDLPAVVRSGRNRGAAPLGGFATA